MQNQNQMEIQFEVPEMDFNIEIEPLQNQSLVMEDSKLIFPKVDLVIDKNGINQLSNPQKTLTKFKIISKNMKELQQIGRGSAGVVKKAIYRVDNKQMIVAIKSIQAQQKQKRDQLLNDLSSFLTGQMSDYLVDFYGCYYDQGLVKQVIEFMNMGSLRNLINLIAKKLLQIDEYILAQIVQRIMKGLHHIHKVKHQIHRDIKPQNILINQNGAVKITDFGISKYIQNTFGQAKTFVGTTIYMSPQRIQFQNTFDGKAKYNSKCDIWSLGLLIYELASGNKLPYTINKKQPIISVLMRIQNSNPPSLQNSGRSQELIDFLKKCLDKNPQKRWSVQELLKHQWIQKYGGKSDLGQFMKKAKQFM